VNLIDNTNDSIELIETGEATAEQLLTAQNFIKRLGEVYRDLKERTEAATISWIERNGDLTDGEVRYYVAPNKSTKCVDVRRTLVALLEAAGGDLDLVASVLASNPYKPAKAREVLGEASTDLFETDVTKDLKTGQPTAKRLQKADPRFIG
jgi:hypothetical protein